MGGSQNVNNRKTLSNKMGGKEGLSSLSSDLEICAPQSHIYRSEKKCSLIQSLN